MKIKVCGLKYLDNLSEVIRLEPEYIGIIKYNKSPRFLNNATELLKILPEKIKSVAVCVDPTLEEILDFEKEGFSHIQFCGNETKEQLENFKKLSKLKFIKSISSTEIESIADWDDFELIIDNKGETYGGTGKSFDWKILENVKRDFILSGGISLIKLPMIKEFILSNSFCIGLDLNSGFEISPGLKNIIDLKSFFKEIHGLQR